MNEIIPRSSRWLRWTHEYMFSLNLVWIIVWIVRGSTKTLGGRVLADYVAVLIRGAYQLVSPIGGHTILEQMVWSFVLAAIGFFLLRLLSRFAVTNIALRTIVGAIAIAAFPIASLFFGLTYPSYPTCCAEAHKTGFALEVIVVLICAILFYLGKRMISGPLMIIALVFHFTMWAWVTSSYFNFLQVSALRSSEYYHPWARTLGVLTLGTIFHFGLPAFGLLASLTWVRYVRRSSESYAPKLSHL
jgi:hypothetical protein